MTVLVQTVRHWHCTHCKQRAITTEAQPHTRFHECAGLGITAPLTEEGVKVKVTAHERDDYVNGDLVRTDVNGRPVMSVVTEYEDGRNDVAVFAPTATGSGGAN